MRVHEDDPPTSGIDPIDLGDHVTLMRDGALQELLRGERQKKRPRAGPPERSRSECALYARSSISPYVFDLTLF
jgi:hypothetical protein